MHKCWFTPTCAIHFSLEFELTFEPLGIDAEIDAQCKTRKVRSQNCIINRRISKYVACFLGQIHVAYLIRQQFVLHFCESTFFVSHFSMVFTTIALDDYVFRTSNNNILVRMSL